MSRKSILIIDLICGGLIIMALAVRISKHLPPAFQNIDSRIENAYKQAIQDRRIINQPDQASEETRGQNKAKPEISAKSYLVGNVETGRIYISHNSNTVLPVASMSKLVTAIAAIENISKDTLVEISEDNAQVAPDGSKIGPGEKFSREEMLYPLLMSSSNVAAEAISSTTNRASFLELMSSYAWEVGMPSTYFADPSGISPRNMSTASDFFALAKYLFEKRKDIIDITKLKNVETATTTEHGFHVFQNIHPFVSDPNFLGGKTGKTPQAGETMLTIMEVNGEPIAVVILASEDRKKDTELLLSKVGLMIKTAKK